MVKENGLPWTDTLNIEWGKDTPETAEEFLTRTGWRYDEATKCWLFRGIGWHGTIHPEQILQEGRYEKMIISNGKIVDSRWLPPESQRRIVIQYDGILPGVQGGRRVFTWEFPNLKDPQPWNKFLWDTLGDLLWWFQCAHWWLMGEEKSMQKAHFFWEDIKFEYETNNTSYGVTGQLLRIHDHITGLAWEIRNKKFHAIPPPNLPWPRVKSVKFYDCQCDGCHFGHGRKHEITHDYWEVVPVTMDMMMFWISSLIEQREEAGKLLDAEGMRSLGLFVTPQALFNAYNASLEKRWS